MSTALNSVVAEVTRQLTDRSRAGRKAYLQRVDRSAAQLSLRPARVDLGCSNLAHVVAPCAGSDRDTLSADEGMSVGIVTAYNDMLSAHAPFEHYPAHIKSAARSAGAVARVAGGVPAMCDGITQGRDGMELSLFSRDVIAMSTAIALSHDVFDAALLLGVCDKIVPGLVTGALAFGHLPAALIPAGPMASGRSNAEKAETRRAYAAGEINRDALLASEVASYHSPGTCTFYGTANSNQMLMDVMGLHLPGAAFIHPEDPLRDAVTAATTRRVVDIAASERPYGIGHVVDERSIVNGVVALLATGGSTNHTMHLVSIAAAAGVDLRWEDFDLLSGVVPLVARIYPNGPADVNHFHAAGGTPFLVGTLLDAGLLHEDVLTLAGPGLRQYSRRPVLGADGGVDFVPSTASSDLSVLRPADRPFAPDGGLRVLEGTLGRAVIKTSSLRDEHRVVEAPARVFTDQVAFLRAFSRRELDRDVVVVLREQGPSANGMPELHALTPSLAAMQKRGHAVALVTDGRMSGASGSIPAAIHVTPESVHGGPISRIHDGDLVRVDSRSGRIDVLVDGGEFADRPSEPRVTEDAVGMGRELFAMFRAAVGRADEGAHVFGPPSQEPRSAAIVSGGPVVEESR
ncbi:phosphogluconate dehydratase [Flexivirga endophytica]|uniref:Phosphogluconate dehydratase n=1 Tax=Flexivirga endophytica TaxID=1849103 RepID=A0A916T9I6_9MICO|nr:phosphogluconate dehydratase [Flexivirga endophytica]GGB35027.1 phosphogluconate dehydratase [Flexivirga endophytica]GHB42870.1 phosphogluconate dehydratase [Flexivirga endophytica]